MQEETNAELPDYLQVAQSKPTGIKIMLVLHAIGCLFILPGLLMFLSVGEEADETLAKLGSNATEVFIGLAAVGVLVVASTIGMFLGTRWGWWVTAYYYVHSIGQKILAFVNVYSLADQLGGTEGDFSKFAFKSISRICVSLLFLIYLFRPNVWDYFGLDATKKRIALLTLVGLYIIEVVVFTLISSIW